MTLRRSIVFATNLLAPLGDLARGAEAAGFDRVWTTEFPDRDALPYFRGRVEGLHQEARSAGLAPLPVYGSG